jgi:hypothetical protein
MLIAAPALKVDSRHVTGRSVKQDGSWPRYRRTGAVLPFVSEGGLEPPFPVKGTSTSS